MNIFILILTLITPTGSDVYSLEIYGIENCKAAGHDWMNAAKGINQEVGASILCVRK